MEGHGVDVVLRFVVLGPSARFCARHIMTSSRFTAGQGFKETALATSTGVMGPETFS